MIDRLPLTCSDNVLVGIRSMDDAGVYRLTDELALVQTVDFFYPIVDDPRSFGRIVAANSMSDIWAMGAEAVTALNHLAYPAGKLGPEVIEELLHGAAEKLSEAGVSLMGGHTLEQEELVFGMSVTGLISPGSATTNSTARAGDLLVLTKPLGTGIYCDAMRQGGLPEDRLDAWVASMERLNMYASRIMQRFDVSCMTDVTGFGLLGHALPMARNAGVRMVLQAERVPLLPGLPGMLDTYNPKGVCKCRDYVDPVMTVAPDVDPRLVTLMSEAQTSGGLLAAVAPGECDRLVRALVDEGDGCARVIGSVTSGEDDSVLLEVVRR